MPSTDPVTSITTWYRLILTRYHQIPIFTVLYTALSPLNAELSQLDLVCFDVEFCNFVGTHNTNNGKILPLLNVA